MTMLGANRELAAVSALLASASTLAFTGFDLPHSDRIALTVASIVAVLLTMSLVVAFTRKHATPIKARVRLTHRRA